MVRILSVSFLFLYLVALVRPVFPLVEYWANKEYIAENYCQDRFLEITMCHGYCYLQTQLKIELSGGPEQHNQDESGPTKLELEKFPFSIIKEPRTEESIFQLVSRNHLIFKNIIYSPPFIQKETPPPNTIIS
ncbi:hypothetical protein OO013_06910 [Mangrovivirga sp. M17]|uniref:Uncharacterized protein n=1 Tax=Mangrovivirga halotolerans TaxID=2993936 RepID=A0ABT3RQQ8_9BACT|nr:hypothetical protein [Mangrovivirga halotolerans]MCX2743587.1 hypothetical protein [Mangrovivirga halotolerans]